MDRILGGEPVSRVHLAHIVGRTCWQEEPWGRAVVTPSLPPSFLLHALLKLVLVIGILPSLCFAGGVREECTPDPTAPCLETPEAYVDAWRRNSVSCVAPSLYTTIPWDYQPEVGKAQLYPEEFEYAWAGGHHNLETFLKVRCRYQEDPAKVRVAIESYVGFPVPIRNRDPEAAASALPIFIYTLGSVAPDDEGRSVEVIIPSFASWVHILDQEFGLRFDLDAQREVIARYASLRAFARRPPGKQHDPVWAFSELTGCKRSPDWRLAPGFPPTESLTGCSDAYRRARAAAGGIKVGPGGPTTRACFENFAADASVPRDATALRALLELCQDASALNTGVGLGFNVMPHPLNCSRWSRQTVEDKLTGPEFILPNGTLKPEERGRGWSVVELERLEDARYDLRRGYCR